MTDFTTELLGEYHEVNPISPGMSKEEFKSRLVQRMHFEDVRYGDAMIEEMSKAKVIGKNSSTIALAKFEAKYTSGFAKIREDIIKTYQQAGTDAYGCVGAGRDFCQSGSSVLYGQDLLG